MTDRINALTIVLKEDVRDDDAKALISAIGQLRNVLSVTPNIAGPLDDHIAQQRVRRELSEKLWAALL